MYEDIWKKNPINKVKNTNKYMYEGLFFLLNNNL